MSAQLHVEYTYLSQARVLAAAAVALRFGADAVEITRDAESIDGACWRLETSGLPVSAVGEIDKAATS